MILFFMLLLLTNHCCAMDSMREPIATLDEIADKIESVNSVCNASIKRIRAASRRCAWLTLSFKSQDNILDTLIMNYSKIDPYWQIMYQDTFCNDQGEMIITYQITDENLGLKLIERNYPLAGRKEAVEQYKRDMNETHTRDALLDAKFANDSSVCSIQ